MQKLKINVLNRQNDHLRKNNESSWLYVNLKLKTIAVLNIIIVFFFYI